jgi:parallel beta-helix repeat protein
MATTLFVGGSGPGNYTTIQEAVDAAFPGDVVFVYNGTYAENVNVNKTITLQGEDRDTTIVDGGSGSAFALSADWVNITGFAVVDGGFWAIYLYSVQNCRITDTNVSGSFNGVYLELSDNNTIDGNNLSNNFQAGAYLKWSNGNTIANNIASDNWNGSFYLWESNSNIFDNNVGSYNEFAITLYRSPSNTITNNTFGNNVWKSIYIADSDNSLISNNILQDNGGEVFIQGSAGSIISNNTISSTDTRIAIYLWSSPGSTLTGNTMIKNGVYLVDKWYSTTIDTSNTVNGRPVYFWKNVSGGTVPLGAGQVILANCPNVIVENQNVSDGAYGITVAESAYVTVANNTALDGLGGIMALDSTNLTIVNNDASGNKFDGISIRSTDGSVISDNTASSNGGEGIHLNGADVSLVTNNTALTNTYSGIRFSWSTKNTISRNVLSSNGNHGMYFFSGSVNNTVSDNNISGSQYGIRLSSQSDGNTFSGNTVSNSVIGIYLNSVIGETLTDNIMIGTGIQIDGVLSYWNSHSIDTSNTVNGKPVYYWVNIVGGSIPPGAGQVILVNCGNIAIEYQDLSDGSVGIQLGYSSMITITNNTIVSNKNRGIIIFESNDNTVSKNDISWSGGFGVYTRGVRNVFNGNTVSNNLEGFYFSGGDSNSVIANNISDNIDCGIRLFSSSTNHVIHHNNIMDNGLQAYDSGSTTLWDDDYPSGGNYWSDYAGVDLKHGALQDQPGGDDIGDMPYVIDVNSRDRFPLMSPVGVYGLRPPVIIGGDLIGISFENVKITWLLSPDDGGGFNSVTDYEIYRGTSFDSDGLGYALIATVTAGTTQYIDSLAGEGDSNYYFYQVCSIDINNNVSCSKTQGGKFTRFLLKGPNMFSIPLTQSDVKVRTVLQTLWWDRVGVYNKSANDRWIWHDKTKGVQELQLTRLVDGYWVNVTRNSNFTIAGVVPLETEIHLRMGWNLIGFPSFNTTYSVLDLKNATGAIAVETFDPTSPPYFLRKMQDWEVLQAGHAYWVQIDTLYARFTVRNE